MRRFLWVWTCAIVCGVLVSMVPLRATTIRSVKLAALFEEADRVVEIKILSGDNEHYESAVYKAIVEEVYKGAAKGDVIFFGPFEGYEIGGRYFLFLKRGTAEATKTAGGPSYGTVERLDRVMYAGYAALQVGYECVFDGEEAKQTCDESVQLNPEQVVLPHEIHTFPDGDATPVTNYKKWVRRKVFLAELEKLKRKAQTK